MSSQLRKMGRRIMKKHKMLPSKRKRGGIPFGKWTKMILQMLEERDRRAAGSVVEQLKAEEGKDEGQRNGEGTPEVQEVRTQDQGSSARRRRPSQGRRQAVQKKIEACLGIARSLIEQSWWIFAAAVLALGFSAAWLVTHLQLF